MMHGEPNVVIIGIPEALERRRDDPEHHLDELPLDDATDEEEDENDGIGHGHTTKWASEKNQRCWIGCIFFLTVIAIAFITTGVVVANNRQPSESRTTVGAVKENDETLFVVVVSSSSPTSTAVVMGDADAPSLSPSVSPSMMIDSKNQTGYPAFSQSKAFIDSICGDQNDETMVAADECMNACEGVLECCRSNEFDCWSNNLAGCTAYSKCHVTGGDDIGPAPSNLGEICSGVLDSTMENTTECEEACSNVTCCFVQEETGCTVMDNLLVCLDYAPCQILHQSSNGRAGSNTTSNTTTTIPVAPEGLDLICLNVDEDGNSTTSNREVCNATCEEASCCWSDGTEDVNCLQTNFLECLTYAPCGLLVIPEANMAVPEPPLDLNETCSLETLLNSSDVESRKACEDVCQSAACCLSTPATTPNETISRNGSNNCFVQDPLGCLGYAACAFLDQTGGIVPPAPDDLDDVCRWSTILTGGDDAISACRDACEPASCCFSLSNETDYCLADGNSIACFGYTVPCAILLLVGEDEDNEADGVDANMTVVDDVITAPPDDVGSICGRQAYQTNSTPCKELCFNGIAGCCFDDNDETNCSLEYLAQCAQWSVAGCFRAELDCDAWWCP